MVIAIVGILVSLTMPAVMSAIESSRRTKCANNLRQIALAATQYETQLRQYPLNWGQVSSVGIPTTNAGTGVIGVSWLTSLLPYMDNTPLYSQVMFNQPMNYSDTNGYSNITVLSTPVATFLCPSDTQTGTINNQELTIGNNTYGTTNYKACAGSNWMYSYVNGVQGPAQSWTVGRNANNSDGVDHGNGVICRGGVTSLPFVAGGPPLVTANMDIRDGASKTFLCGEAVPAWCGWSLWFWFDGATATCGTPLNLRMPGKTPESQAGNWPVSYGFMSRHKQGANFAMCDGSVSYVNEALCITPAGTVIPAGMAIYQGFATIDGNEAVSLP